jgi:hypothetical protein
VHAQADVERMHDERDQRAAQHQRRRQPRAAGAVQQRGRAAQGQQRQADGQALAGPQRAQAQRRLDRADGRGHATDDEDDPDQRARRHALQRRAGVGRFRGR